MIWELFDRKEFNLTIILICLMVFGAILEAISVGMVFPILNFISDISDQQNKYLNEIFIFFNIDDQNTKVLFVATFFLSIFFLKALYLSFLTWFTFFFAFNYEVKVCTNLFTHYLSQDLKSFNKQNPSTIIQNIVKEVNILIFNYLIPLLRFFTELMVIVIIVFMLVYLEPLIAFITASICFFFAFVYYFYIGKKLVPEWGRYRIYNDNIRTKKIRETFSNFKLIKVLNLKKYFENSFQENNSEISKFNRYQQTTLTLPTIFLEFIAVLCLVIVIWIVVLTGRNYIEIIPVTGLFAAAAFRLIPAINRALSSLQSTRFAKPSLKVIYEQLNKKTNKLSFEDKKICYEKFESIEFKDVYFSYDENNNILENINLEIKKGDFVGIVGESGCGKTTIGDLILGLSKPTKGEILFNNKDKISYKTGYVPQNTILIEDTVIKNVAFGQEDKDINIDKVKRVLDQTQLSSLVNKLDKGIYSTISDMGSNLSGGQIQRISVARALYFDPDIILFDEPTSSLDSLTENKLLGELSLIKKNTFCTFVIISHRMQTLEKCNKIFKIKNKILMIDSK